jgi:hypothetical protein
MVPTPQTQPPIIEHLLGRLKAADCVRGRFVANGPTLPFELNGERGNGAAVLLPGLGQPLLNELVAEYFDCYYSAGFVRLTIEVDVATGRSVYARLTAAQVAAHDRAEQQRQAAGKKALPRHRSPYGAALAAQVAAALSNGRSLMPYHRDYCGMGLEHSNSHFIYGEVWDGRYLEPQLIFSSREDFVSWLARQSNQALARLEETDPWYWHNQTVTRQRLLEFVQA